MASISANAHVTKVSAELVKFGYLLAATVGKLRKTSSAATVMMRRRASGLIRQKTEAWLRKNGRASSNAEMSAVGSLTVESIAAEKVVIRKI